MVVGTVLTAAGFCTYNLLIGLPMISMSKRRHELLVKARSPILALCYGSSFLLFGDVMWIQELLRQHNIVMPASVMIWTTSIAFAVVIASGILRAARVLIITSASERKSMLKYLTRRSQMIFTAVVVCSMLLLGVLIEIARYTNVFGVDYAFIAQPALVYTSVSCLVSVPISKYGLLMVAANDSLKVGIELVRVMMYVYIIMGPYFILLILHNYKVVEVDTRIQFIAVFAYLCMCLDTFVYSRRRWVRAGSPSTVHVNHTFTQRPTEITSLTLLADPILTLLYSKHVERNLCYESYSFLSEAMEWRRNMSSSDITQQFQDCTTLVGKYIIQGSSLEINVGWSLQKPVLAKAKEAVYMQLSEAERESIFKEIGKMLDQNLLASFQDSQPYRDTVTARMKSASNLPSPLSSFSLFKALSTKMSEDGVPEHQDVEDDLVTMIEML